MLVVAPRQRLARPLGRLLRSVGYRATALDTVDDALEALRHNGYGLVLVHRDLMNADGLELLSALRQKGDDTPVILLGCRGGPWERIAALNEGADDCLDDAFVPDELIARIGSVMRRPRRLVGARLRLGNIVFDTLARTLLVDGRRCALSARELRLCELFLRTGGEAVSRALLQSAASATESACSATAIGAAISQLRRKLALAGATVKVEALRGRGYRISEAGLP